MSGGAGPGRRDEAGIDVEVNVTDPEIVTITVRMCNQHHGAAFPGQVLELGEELGRALVREGLAEQVRP